MGSGRRGEWRTHTELLSVYAGGELVADAESSSGALKVRANSDFIASASRIAPAIRALLGRVGELDGKLETASEELKAEQFVTSRQNAELAALTSRNRQLTEALEFYADANNWSECNECGSSTCYGKVPVIRADGKIDKRYKHGEYRDDEGITARSALAALGQKEGKLWA